MLTADLTVVELPTEQALVDAVIDLGLLTGNTLAVVRYAASG